MNRDGLEPGRGCQREESKRVGPSGAGDRDRRDRVVEPDHRAVVEGRDELDVDGALGGAGRQVLIRDVAVVLRGADDAGGVVVGAQEVQEVDPRERVVVGEQPVRQRDAVAPRQAADRTGVGQGRSTVEAG